MKRFVEGEERTQGTLLPERLDDYVAEQNSVRVIDVFVDELDLAELGFASVHPATTGRPAYHPADLLKIYYLRLPQPHPVKPPAGARSSAQRRVNVADETPDT
jgi:transposase